MIKEKKTIRCAVYTRKSIDDGTLDMEFNSLDAQREAGENYIASQRSNGWIHYDDAGFSGGTLERPALIRLKADIVAGKIDMIVVYKLDRLSRSLMDFADLQTFFDKYDVSFCSVTQEINTSTSAGRMMLNILMSFCQYERELIADRVRDKMAASKKRGMRMGGYVPYGYRVEEKKLYPDPVEAPVIKRVFQRFLETQSPKLIAFELNRADIRPRSGKLWTHCYIARLLANPVYAGNVTYRGAVYKGEHEGIVPQKIWDRAKKITTSNQPYDRSGGVTEITVPLRGLLRCGHCGCAMKPVFCTRGKKRYYYYYCDQDSKRSEKTCPVSKIGSTVIEEAVREQAKIIFSSALFQEKVTAQTGLTIPELQRLFSNEFWNEISALELNRLYSELFAKITVSETQLAYEIKTSGVKALIEGVTDDEHQ